MKILNMGDADFIDQLEDAIGCSLAECNFITPQFNRVDGILPGRPPKDVKFFDGIKKAPDRILLQLGLQRWEAGHWLYPGEWYDSIPEGYRILDINGEEESFVHGETDDDIRCGCLAYGFMKEAKDD